jgi:DNA-binding response OmpR family regulator
MRILVIEDDPVLLELLKRILARAGYQVSGAANGEVGLALFRAAPTDVVVTDMMMPVKDGIATIIELRRDFPQVKILAISAASGSGPDDPLSVAKACGAQGTLAKPIGRRALLAAVCALLT